MGRVDHQPDPAARRQRLRQRPEPGIRVGQVVQHAAAVDVVERAELRRRQQITGDKADRTQPARLRPRLGHGAAGLRHIQIGDLGRAADIGQLNRQHDQPVAGAAAGHQRPERLRPVAPPAIEEMVDLDRMRGRALDQPLRLVGRVPLGVGIGLVLPSDRVHRLPFRGSVVGDDRVDLDLDQPFGIHETGDLHDRVNRLRGDAVFLAHIDNLLPVFDIGQDQPRADHVMPA